MNAVMATCLDTTHMKSTVQYLSNKDDKWKTVNIISRGTGKYRNFLNIEDKETYQIKCIDWKEE